MLAAADSRLAAVTPAAAATRNAAAASLIAARVTAADVGGGPLGPHLEAEAVCLSVTLTRSLAVGPAVFAADSAQTRLAQCPATTMGSNLSGTGYVFIFSTGKMVWLACVSEGKTMHEFFALQCV